MSTLARKKLPIGIQTFARIREEGYYYADKSGYTVDLAEGGSYYFLSRPRRFGKSLFLDTLKDLFEGNQKLFEGLQAENRWDWKKKHPVIRISFSDGVLKSKDELNDRIHGILHENRTILKQTRSKELRDGDIAGALHEMIVKAHEKAGQRVVVLIDEYDKPILDNITNREIATDMREGLKNIYSVLKGADAHLRFVFITGVSKFSKVSLFSGLNNLQDITLLPKYSAICGYTDDDIDTVFAPELPGLDRKRIKDYYNGYNWLGVGVYNPFDVLLLFSQREFKNHWFETGTPTFLVEKLFQREVFTPDLERVFASEDLISTFDVDDIPVEALMFQAGYLTIESEMVLPGYKQYALCFPNMEVKASMNRLLAQRMMGDARAFGINGSHLYTALLANDFERIKKVFQQFFSSIPYHWYTNNLIAQYEGYYASIFYSHFAGLGVPTQVEDATNHGRVDMTVCFNGHVYIFEFKVVEFNPQGAALAQIKDRNYADKYKARNEPIHLVGVEFSKASRNIVGFDVEHLA